MNAVQQNRAAYFGGLTVARQVYPTDEDFGVQSFTELLRHVGRLGPLLWTDIVQDFDTSPCITVACDASGPAFRSGGGLFL